MANKNKNSNKLVPPADPETHLATDARPVLNDVRGVEPEIEVDALTFDIDEQHSEINGRSRAELKAALEERQEELEHLRYELEQLTSKQRGQDAELAARAEITDDLNKTIDSIESRLAKSESSHDELLDKNADLEHKLTKSNNKRDALQEKISGLEGSLKVVQETLRTQQRELAKKQKRLTALEKESRKPRQRNNSGRPQVASEHAAAEKLRKTRLQVSELQTYIDGRRTRWDELDEELKTANAKIDEQAAHIQELTTELESRNDQLVRSREQYISTSEKLAQQKSQVRKLRKRGRELEQELNVEAKQEISKSHRKIAEQSGELEAYRQDIAALRSDQEKVSEYSDALRMQLQDQISISKVSVAMREKLEAGLDAANQTIEELSNRYAEEQEKNNRLLEDQQTMQQEFEREIRQIRFELGQAEETIAGQETINEQLVSDLVDNRSFRQALESQLGEVEQESSESLSELESNLRNARNEADDLVRQLKDKDAVISDLMGELASQSDTIEIKDESSGMLQKIDGFKDDEKPRHAVGNERDHRVTRQLIGSADGKELRFPLFKDRLTIGRTVHNDIQLNMQFISRRHAVISTDHGQTRVIDWGSKNGVFVNDVQVTEQMLTSGDVVTIGTTEFRYEERDKL